MLKHYIYSSLLSILMLAGPAYAIHPLITDDTGTQDTGGIEIELSGEYGYEDEYGTKEHSASAGISMAAGVYTTIDVILGLPYQWVWTRESGDCNMDDGLGDMACEIKWRLFEHGPLSLALKPGLIIPTGDDKNGMGNGRVGYTGFLVSTLAREKYAVHLNAGYCRNRNVLGDRVDLWHASIAGEYLLTEKFTVVMNIGCERNPSPGETTNPVFMLAGMAYAVNDLCLIDCGLKWGCTGPETDITVLAGCTVHFATIENKNQEE